MFKLIFHRRCSSHDFRQFFGAGHRLFAVTLDNGAGNAFGKTLFTIGFQYQAISASSAVCSHSAADCPRVGSIRMSSGPSRIKEKPRSASSSCGEETPRLRRMPSILPITSRSATYSPSAEKGPWMMEKRGSSIVFATAIACGSR